MEYAAASIVMLRLIEAHRKEMLIVIHVELHK
jgi:hypothetical protein